MSKALVIKGADFSYNKLTTVTFQETVHCTGIALNSSAITPSYHGTETLIASVTPVNTTDVVQWSTSNINVATVESGVITAVGIGTATITATCGSFSDTCTVTVSAPAVLGSKISGYRVNGSGSKESGGTGLGYLASAWSYGAIASETGTYGLYKWAQSIQEDYYPIEVPQNTAKIRVTANGSNYYSSKMAFFNRNTTLEGYENTVDTLSLIQEVFVDGVAEFTIPTYEGGPVVDGFVVSFEKTGSGFNNNDFNNFTVQFVPAE